MARVRPRPAVGLAMKLIFMSSTPEVRRVRSRGALSREPRPSAAGRRNGSAIAAKHRTGSALAAIVIVGALAANAFGAGANSAPAAAPATATLKPWLVGPVPQVRAICHAGDSLWVGTNAGVFISDIRDPSRRARVVAGPQLPSNSVRAIASRGDSVWVATDAGVSIFSHGRVHVLSAREAKPRSVVPLRKVQNVAFGNRGEVLLATRGGGVGVLAGTRNFAITKRDSLIDVNIYDILERPGRPRLYACGAGVCAQIDDTTMVSFQAGAGFPRGEARQVVGDERSAFVRIARRGVFRFDGKHATMLEGPKGVSFVDANSIALGADHALWVAGPGWICVGRANKWQSVQVPALDWRVIVADGGGAFAGSSDGVVIALGRGGDFKLTLGEGLPAPAVASIKPDGHGGMWFVNGGRVMNANAVAQTLTVEKSPLDAEAVEISPGEEVLAVSRWTVSRKDATGWTDLKPDMAEADAAFASVAVDDKNMVWVGARSGALYRYDGEIWLRYEQPRNGADAVRDARAYSASDWAIVGAFPMRGHDGCWTRFTDWDSTRAVVDVAEDAAGNWFAATRDRVYRYDGERGTWLALGPSGSGGKAPWDTPGPITAITFDPAGRLFVGTEDGLGCLSKGRLTWWSARDGIGGERVNDLAADRTTLWVGYGEDGFAALPLADLR